MDNPFSWGYLTTVPGTNEVFGPFAIIYLVLFGLGFLLSIVLYNDGAKRYVDHPLKRRTVRNGAGIALIVCGSGLFFFGIRVLQINPLSFGMRIWLWLSLAAAVLTAAMFAYYLKTRYPAALRSYEERRRKQQYLRPALASPPSTGRSVQPRTAKPMKRHRR